MSAFRCAAPSSLSPRPPPEKSRQGRERLTGKSPMGPTICSICAVTKSMSRDGGMTVGDLVRGCDRLERQHGGQSVLEVIGGPAGLTPSPARLATMTRLDRNEPTLNDATPGDPRDTTSPPPWPPGHAEGVGWRCALRLGASCNVVIGDKVGDKRLRAGLPASWRIGDKTGTGEHGSTNTVAIIWPPGRAPLIATVFFAEFIRVRWTRATRSTRRSEASSPRRSDKKGPARSRPLSSPRDVEDQLPPRRRCRPSSACRRRGRYRSGRLEGALPSLMSLRKYIALYPISNGRWPT